MDKIEKKRVSHYQLVCGENDDRRRLGYIDISKGLGMLTIVWGHICLTGFSNHIVYSFHIPLFFFLSGLVFLPKRYSNFSVLLKKRLKGLLIPYAVYSILTWIIWVVYSFAIHAKVDNYWMPLIETFFAQGSEGYLVHNVPLWFVTCLFSVEIIYWFLSKLKDWANILLCVMLCGFGVLSTKVTFFDFSTLPWSLDVALMALPFYCAGSLLAKYVPYKKQVEAVGNNRTLSMGLFVVASVVVCLGAKYNGQVSMGHASLGHSPWMFYGTASFGVLGLLILSVSLSFFDSNLVNGVKWIGRNSFRVMAVHNPIKGIVIIIIAELLRTDTVFSINYNVPQSLIAYGVTLIVTFFVVYVIERLLWVSFKRNTLF